MTVMEVEVHLQFISNTMAYPSLPFLHDGMSRQSNYSCIVHHNQINGPTSNCHIKHLHHKPTTPQYALEHSQVNHHIDNHASPSINQKQCGVHTTKMDRMPVDIIGTNTHEPLQTNCPSKIYFVRLKL